jgi:radical SAM protein with 4Fe4S-binding SPASM domain
MSVALEDIIPLLAHPSEDLAKLAQVVLAEEPLTHLEPIPWEDYEELWDPDKEAREEVSWCRVREWKAGVRRLLEIADWRFVENNVELWLRVAPVMYPFLRHHSQGHPELRKAIDQAWRKYLIWKYPPQLMIYLTDHCQLRCRYCYVDEKVSQGRRELPLEKVEPLLDWAKDHNFSSISLTGGEPTLYPHFPELVKAIRKRDFPLYFATNLLFPASLRSWVEGVASLEVHLCDPGDYSSSQLEMLEENRNWLRTQNFPKVFRYNLWQRQPSDWEWVIEKAATFGNGDFAFAVPFPSPSRKNLYLQRTELEKFAKVVTEFFRFCEEKGIRAVAAKPYPLCAFPEEDASVLLKHRALRGTCEIGASHCMRNLMVDPQLQVFPCVALDLSPGAITTFPPQKQFMERLRRMVRGFLEKVDYERCRRCELRSWKLCTGGCLAYYSPTKIGDFPPEGGENGGEYPSHELL